MISPDPNISEQPGAQRKFRVCGLDPRATPRMAQGYTPEFAVIPHFQTDAHGETPEIVTA
jgi:hypothetical protein